jgi:membrane fusion protein (multidrug efflux system)
MTDTGTPNARPAANAEGQPAPPPQPRPIGRLILLAAIAVALIFGFHLAVEYSVKSFTHESTDDAFLDAHIVAVAPRVAGQVKAVHIQENQNVAKGDLLVELDPGDFDVKLAQKNAAVAGADANLNAAKAGVALVKARLETAKATERQEQANADASRAKSQRAQADLERNKTLRQTGVVSQEEFDRVRAEADWAAADLRAAEQKASAATSQLAEAHAQIGVAETVLEGTATRTKQARTDEQAAELDLSYTKLAAPSDGRVTRKAVEPGAYVQIGQSLMAIVPTNLWVSANFKETQLTRMRAGQPVEIHLDAYPDKPLRGHVDSFMAGSGARFSLLPPENAVGNFVKVVQRVPVKILFDEPVDPALSLGPGMSVLPSVRIGEFTLSPGLQWVAAVVLAGLTTLGLARVMAHLRDG